MVQLFETMILVLQSTSPITRKFFPTSEKKRFQCNVQIIHFTTMTELAPRKVLLNGYNIEFGNVIYTKQVNKNLLNGIKLAKNDLKCNIKTRKEKSISHLKDKT